MMTKAEISDQKVKELKSFDQPVEAQANHPKGTLPLDLQMPLSKEKESDILQLKLAEIEAILNDKIEESLTPSQKKEKIKLFLAENALSTQGDVLREITEVIENDHLHVCDQLSAIQALLENSKSSLIEDDHSICNQFASIQAVSGNSKSQNSNNPWVQTYRALHLIGSGSRKSIEEEKRREERSKKSWKTSMDEKAALYPEMADTQLMFAVANVLLLGASAAVLPALGGKLFEKSTVDALSEALKNGGPKVLELASNTSSYLKKEKETTQDCSTQQERQSLDNRIQVIQDSLREHQSLRERALEVIKTITSQVMGR